MSNQDADKQTSGLVGQSYTTATVNMMSCLQAATVNGNSGKTYCVLTDADSKSIYDGYYVNAIGTTDGQGEQATIADLYSGQLASNLQWGQELKYGDNPEEYNVTGVIESDIPSPFNDKALTNTRADVTKQWGTIVLPYSFNANDYTENINFYSLTGIDDSSLEMEQQTGTIAAGTPLIYCINSDAFEDGKYTFTIAGTHFDVNLTDAPSGETNDDVTLVGTYHLKNLTAENGYIIRDNKFWNINKLNTSGDVFITAYRAYIAASAAQSRECLNIEWNNPTAISNVMTTLNGMQTGAIYDTAGRRQPMLQHGLNIVKYSDGTSRSIIVK